jgi:hypothetical protein
MLILIIFLWAMNNGLENNRIFGLKGINMMIILARVVIIITMTIILSLVKIKLKILVFLEKNDPKVYLEWENMVEYIF